jgi:hypothetical protein
MSIKLSKEQWIRAGWAQVYQIDIVSSGCSSLAIPLKKERRPRPSRGGGQTYV